MRYRRLENSAATTQYSPAKFCLFRDRALPFHNNPPVTLQYSAATPILNENPLGVYVLQGPQLYLLKVKDISECFANFGNFTGFCGLKTLCELRRSAVQVSHRHPLILRSLKRSSSGLAGP